MRIRSTIPTLAIALFGLSWAADARAQTTPYELNLHVGAFDADHTDDTDAMLGARIMLQYPSGWAWGGNFDWVNQDELTVGDEDIDANLYLYSFEVDYTFSPGARLRPFVGGGIGAATQKISDLPGPDDTDTETNVLIPLAGGIKWFDQPRNPSWAIRGDIRDNILFNEGPDDDATNNWEFSGGVSFFF